MTSALGDLIGRAAQADPPPSVTRHDLDQLDTDLGILARDLDVDLENHQQATAAAFGALVAPVAAIVAGHPRDEAHRIARYLLAQRSERTKP